MSPQTNDGYSWNDPAQLKSKKLPNLQAIAKSLGVRRVTGVKKQLLIDTIIEISSRQMSNLKIKKVSTSKEVSTPLLFTEPRTATQIKMTANNLYGGGDHVISYKDEKEEAKDQKNNKRSSYKNSDRQHNKAPNRARNRRRYEHDELPTSDAPTLKAVSYTHLRAHET